MKIGALAAEYCKSVYDTREGIQEGTIHVRPNERIPMDGQLLNHYVRFLILGQHEKVVMIGYTWPLYQPIGSTKTPFGDRNVSIELEGNMLILRTNGTTSKMVIAQWLNLNQSDFRSIVDPLLCTREGIK